MLTGPSIRLILDFFFRSNLNSEVVHSFFSVSTELFWCISNLWEVSTFLSSNVVLHRLHISFTIAEHTSRICWWHISMWFFTRLRVLNPASQFLQAYSSPFPSVPRLTIILLSVTISWCAFSTCLRRFSPRSNFSPHPSQVSPSWNCILCTTSILPSSYPLPGRLT